jgi:hypothetical protein
MSGFPVPPDEMKRRLRNVLSRISGIPDPERDAISVLIMAGEWEVALETLCTQIFEYDIDIDSVVRQELVDLGERTHVAVAYLLGDPWAHRPDKE